jgi:hypothetical protein
MEYLTSFHKFDPSAIRDHNYKNYLQELYDYLVSFFRRSQPLFMLDATITKFTEEFNSLWSQKVYVPVGTEPAPEPRQVRNSAVLCARLFGFVKAHCIC